MAQSLRMDQTMRWYGPTDPVPLQYLRQAGVSGIVTALHHIPKDKSWSTQEIQTRKKLIESNGLNWRVVESVPIHEDIKTRSGNYKQHIQTFISTINNLAQNGIKIVCYNFMPLLDWTRTNLAVETPEGSEALAFHWKDVIIFDLYILKRKNADLDYHNLDRPSIESYYKSLSKTQLAIIRKNIIGGLPGGEQSFSLRKFKEAHNTFRKISRDQLKYNLTSFLADVVPSAEQAGIRLAIHPDDPPFSLFGIPRVVTDEEDLKFILNAVNSPYNGFTFCSGSYGANPNNDLAGMIQRWGHRMHFIHLRNIKRCRDGSFTESNHLDGDVDFKSIVKSILSVMKQRNESIPMRPDHGHRMMDDLRRPHRNPGYTAIGRMKGLAEIRGLELGLL